MYLKKLLLFVSFFTGVSSIVLGGGFQLNLQGVRNTGMGHCGTGLLLGPSSSFFNPGAFSFSQTEIEAGLSFVKANVNYQEVFPGAYSANNLSALGTPINFHAAWRIKETGIVVGASIYNPFGSSIQYDDDWKGRFLLRKMSLRTFFYQGTIGYQINDQLGIGVAYVFGTGEFSLRRAIPVQDTLGNYGEANLSGSGIGHGFNAGIMYRPSENLNIGVSFRSGMAVELSNGQAEFDVPSALSEQFPSSTNFTSSINLPGVVNLGVGYHLNEKLLLSTDINYVLWSSYDSLKFDFEDNTEQLQDARSPREYENSFIFRLGAEYQTKDWMAIRMGAYYDMSPVQDGYLTPETPDNNKIGLTLGGSFNFSENFKAHLSLLYVIGPERQDTNLETEFSGVWSSSAIITGISLSYKF